MTRRLLVPVLVLAGCLPIADAFPATQKARKTETPLTRSRPVQKDNLFHDLSLLATTLPAQVPEVYELVIYDRLAFAEAPHADSKTGRGKFKYEEGTVTGPQEESADDCKKTIPLAKVDFSIVPKLVQRAPGLLGAPSNKVVSVQLGAGTSCKNTRWMVHVDDAGTVIFKLDGQVAKIQKM